MGGGVTYGPKETDQTRVYQKLKKQHDMEEQRKELQDQILANKEKDYVAYQKQIQMEKANVQKA